jgi:two-component system phosphate regulon response regulator PhoB
MRVQKIRTRPTLEIQEGTNVKKELILAVEDETDIRELICFNLLRAGYQVSSAVSGEEALEFLSKNKPALVLLDLMLPGIDGLEVCRQIKNNAATKTLPVIMLTARGEESDIVKGLEIGADDYITKPFSPKVMLARVNAVLRRAPVEGDDSGEQEVINIHSITIHSGKHEVLVDGKPADLTATEFRLLRFLARRPGWVFTRQQILDAIHGDLYNITDRAVDVQVVGLRKKLGSAGNHIETVRGVGYRFEE